MVMGGDEKIAIEFTQRFCIKPTSGSVYLKKAKFDNDEIMQINS